MWWELTINEKFKLLHPLHQMEISYFYNLCLKGQQENSFPKAMEDWHHVWIEFSTLHILVTIGLNLKPPNNSICAKTFNALWWKIGGKFEFAQQPKDGVHNNGWSMHRIFAMDEIFIPEKLFVFCPNKLYEQASY